MDAFPESPWSVLGLDGAAATDRDIKRSYARLIKVHRPDTEPEAFQRIHQAYQLALVWRRHRDESAGPEASALDDDATGKEENVESSEVTAQAEIPEMLLEFANPTVSSNGPAPKDVPAVFKPAHDSMEESLAKGDFEAMTKSMELFRAAFRENPSLAREWEKIIMDLFPRDLTSLGLLLTPEEVRRLIEWNCEFLPQPVMMEWHRRRSTAKLVELSTALLDRKAEGAGALEDSEVLAICQARLALLTAFGNHRVAEKLANVVFPKLPPGRRDQIMGEIDQRLALGKLFAVLPMPTRLFFESRLFPGEETVDWSSPESKRALNEVRARCPRDWPGFVVLRQHLPPLIFRELMQMYPIGTKLEVGPGMTRSIHPEEPKRAFPKTFIFILVWMAFIMVRNVNSCSERNPGHSKISLPTLPALPAVPKTSKPYEFHDKLRKDLDPYEFLQALEKSAGVDWQKKDATQNASLVASEFQDNILAALNGVLDPAMVKEINLISVVVPTEKQLKAVQGKFPSYRRGSLKHLTLLVSLLYSSTNSPAIFKAAIDSLLSDHSPGIATNVLIDVRARMTPVQERTDPALAECRRAADVLLDDHSKALNPSQRSGLQNLARP